MPRKDIPREEIESHKRLDTDDIKRRIFYNVPEISWEGLYIIFGLSISLFVCNSNLGYDLWIVQTDFKQKGRGGTYETDIDQGHSSSLLLNLSYMDVAILWGIVFNIQVFTNTKAFHNRKYIWRVVWSTYIVHVVPYIALMPYFLSTHDHIYTC